MPRRIRSSLVAIAIAGLLAACSATPSPEPDAGGDQELVRVPADAATLAEAAAAVAPGGMILIAPGTYEEQLLIDTPDVTVRGEDRNAVIVDGGGVRPYGIVSIADGVRVENLTVTGATFYGVLFTGLHDENGPSAPTADGYERWDPSAFPPLERFLVDHVTAVNNGLYGIYAFNSRHGVIRDSYASGSADSGFYVGQCEDCDVLVTGNVAERSAVGFENANASDSVVIAGNRFSGNRIGMTLLSSYQEAFTPQRGNTIVGNVISGNAEAESPSQADGAFATGIGVSGGVGNVFLRNLIAGHERAGVILANTEDLPTSGTRLEGNRFEGNAVDVANLSAARSPATGNCADDAATTAPASLLEQLRGGCDAATPQDATEALAGPEAPQGISFLRVALPIDQPNLPQRETYDPLPATVAMPELDAIGLPDAALLAELTGRR